MEDRECKLTRCLAYLVWETYNNPDQRVANVYTKPGAEFIKNKLRQPPGLSLFFLAVDGDKIRQDVKGIVPVVPQKSRAYDGEQLQIYNGVTTVAITTQGDATKKLPVGILLQLQFGSALKKKSGVSSKLASMSAYVVGKENVSGIDTYKVQADYKIDEEEGVIYTWWIAPERSYLVIKSEIKAAHEEPQSSLVSYRKVDVVDTIQKEAGIWIPMETRTLMYVTPRDGKELCESVYKWSVLSIQLNSKVSPELFKVALPPETKIAVDEGLSVSTVEGNLETFTSELKDARKAGQQPDFDSFDLKSLEGRLAEGFNAQNTSDQPLLSKVE